jgi:hypothetical protein
MQPDISKLITCTEDKMMSDCAPEGESANAETAFNIALEDAAAAGAGTMAAPSVAAS